MPSGVTFNVEVMRTASMPVSEIQTMAPANGKRCQTIVYALIASHKIPVSSAHVRWAVHRGCTRKMGNGVAELDICGCDASTACCETVYI